MTKTRGLIIGSTGFVALAIGAVLLGVSANAPAQTAATTNLPVVTTISITDYRLVVERRVGNPIQLFLEWLRNSKGVYDLTYRVTVRNAGPALIVVSGRASGAATRVTFPDNIASFGDIAGSGAATSTDTIVIRHDRTWPFNPRDLRWQFTAAPGEGIPPDPGPANDTTVAGIDSDSDGVRDDVERWIAVSYPTSARFRAALAQNSRNRSQALAPGMTRELAIDISNAVGRSIECLSFISNSDSDQWYTALKASQAEYFNTAERWRIYQQYNRLLAGNSGGGVQDEDRASTCDFDIQSLPN